MARFSTFMQALAAMAIAAACSPSERDFGTGGQGGDATGGGGAGGGGGAEPGCGDGDIGPGEQCDDGDTTPGDGCSATCVLESGWTCAGSPSACADIDECANGTHTCDPNALCTNAPGSFSCECLPPYQGDGMVCTTSCGDGTITTGELCDDGNTADGDGCSATCAVEPYFRCNGGACARIRILYAPSASDDAAYRMAIGAITGGVVDFMDVVGATPTSDQLNTYDCVYTWASINYADKVAFGDLLADFVDAGGNVVLGAFCTYTQGNALAGRILTAEYSPVASPTGGNHLTTSSYIGDGTSFLHSGVASYSSNWRDFLVLQGTGVKDGTYADGEIAHAYRADFKVIYSNGVGTMDPNGVGDWPLLVANSCAAGFLQ